MPTCALRIIVAAIVLLVPLLFASPAPANKVDTHIWLAERIIQELRETENGSVSINVGSRTRRFQVSATVRRAILAHPEAFRLGNVGPDAFPGILEGQSVIHPGSGNWGTGEWLTHLLRSARTDEELAFVYGFISHAAADVWAHSYVNHYAGDIFDLTNGEVNVEARHILLEGYIAEHTPWDSGGPRGAFANSLILKDGRYPVPEDFLFRTFVESGPAADAFGSGGARPIKAVHDLYELLGRLAVDGGPADELHNLIQRALIYWFTEYNIRTSELNELNRIHQDVLNAGNDAVDTLQRSHDRLRELNREWMGAAFSQTESILQGAASAVNEIRRLNDQKQGIEREIVSLRNRLPSFPRINVPHPCLKCVRVHGVCVGHRPSICHRLELHPEFARLSDLIAEKHRLENAATQELSNAVNRAKSALNQAHVTMLAVYDAETVALRSAIDLGQRFTANENPIKGVLLAWRADIRLAMGAYFRANAQAIGNSLLGYNVLAPLQYWASCSAMRIVAIPGQVLDVSCSARDAYREVRDLLDAIKRVDPALSRLMTLKDEILGELRLVAEGEALNFVTSVSGIDLRTFADAISVPPSAANLNAAFSAAPPATRLIVVPEIAPIIDRDMFVDTAGNLDPDRFAALHNAFVLMKLSLLGRREIADLFDMRVPANQVEPFNVMQTFALSIDGDYQWMTQSPPYPRSSGSHQQPELSYGYNTNFPLWRTRTQRSRFRQIFRGPLAEGFLVGAFAQTIPRDYLFRPTRRCAFPTTVAAIVCD